METMVGSHRHRSPGVGGGVPASLSGGGLPQSTECTKSTFTVRGGAEVIKSYLHINETGHGHAHTLGKLHVLQKCPLMSHDVNMYFCKQSHPCNIPILSVC